VTERVYVVPPGSQLGPITAAQRQALLANSLVAGTYEKVIDRESAYEMLKGRADSAPNAPAAPGAASTAGGDGGMMGSLNSLLFGSTGPRGAQHDGLVQTMAKSAVRTVGSAVGREILRGVLGGIFGAKRR
jgi:hypothetical protein